MRTSASPMPNDALDSSRQNHVTWLPDPAGWVLQLQHDWRAYTPTAGQAAPVRLPPGIVRIDVTGMTAWDTHLAAALWTLLFPLAQQGWELNLQALAPAQRSPLELALQAQIRPQTSGPATPVPRSNIGAIVRESLTVADLRTTLAFVGELALAAGRLARRPRVFQGADLLHHMDQMGPRSLPIVALTTFLVGLMLAYMGGAQLDRIGAPGFIADVVTVGIVRELAALMTGVILAGRVGAAIAAELGTMTVNQEIDALRALGIDPLQHLALPRLLGMLLVAPLLIGFAMVVGVLAGLPAALLVYGVPAPEYLHKCLSALNWTHLWIGLFKGTMYTLLVVTAGCREGLHAGHNAQAIGVATTRAVVKALVWIVVAACASTVVLQSMGF